MSEILYRRLPNGRYKPVSVYDALSMDAMPQGAHLIVVDGGMTSTRFRVDPDHAPLLAAFHAHRDTLHRVLREASELRSERKTPTKQEQKAWEAFSEIMGDEMMVMSSASASDLLDALEKSLIEKCN